MASLTVRVNAPSNGRWSTVFPIEVRDAAKLVSVARGVSDGKLEVPAGRYFVVALLPNGQQAVADDVVDLQPGDDKLVQVSVTDLDFPPILENTTTWGDSVKQFARPVTQYFTRYNSSIIRGNWLSAKMEPDAALSLGRAPTTRASIEVKFAEVPTWVEIAGRSDCCYLAVPVDENRSTTMQWDMDSKTETLNLKFDFGEGKLNSFFDFIENDQALEARSISQSIIAQSEQFLMDKSRSALLAILGAYVLLRAAQRDDMGAWTGKLISVCPWSPDALAIRVECLARNGEHAPALRLLLDAPKWGTPWFRSGVGYLEKRAKLYANVATNKRSDLQIGDEDLKKIQRIAIVFGELAAALDMTHTTTVLRAMPRIA